jgi:hypothetical protein
VSDVVQAIVANAAVLITLVFLAAFMAVTLFLSGRQDDV